MGLTWGVRGPATGLVYRMQEKEGWYKVILGNRPHHMNTLSPKDREKLMTWVGFDF